MQSLLLPYPGWPVGTVAWLLTSALSSLFQRLKAWLKHLDLIFVLSGQAIPKETHQSKGPKAGVRYTGEKVAALSALRTLHLPARAGL